MVRSRNAGTEAAATVAQGKLDELTAAGASEETLSALRSVIQEIFGFENLSLPSTPLKTKAALQQETLAALSLYVGRHTWTQLTTEQKECFADAIDADREHDPDLGRVDRWWRD